ncbi:MAG: hypothetical protein HQK84_04135 [Nitrospinae bacterium]|nr:hypothetical protein [Nitrospinota bacterium]
MNMHMKFIYILFFILALSGCAKNPVTSLCDFSATYPDEVVASTKINGSIVTGNVSSEVFLPEMKYLPSSVATTSKPFIMVPIRNSVCQGPYGPQPCFQQINLNGIYGIGRANDLDEAKKIAIENCKNAVQHFTDYTGIWALDNSMNCVIRKSENCLVR